ncbi:MAG: hypothetical protein KUG68_09760 [Flavobacteriaceae bacterium]|nr:hypothetical protein [Flavobacteriaceae bacterium]
MKKGNLGIVILLCIVTFVTSCSSDDDTTTNTTDNTAEIIQTTNTVTTGDWMITSFIDSGDDETSNFSGYTFAFNSNGALVATKGATTVNGTWSITDDDDDSSDDDSDGDSSNDIDFNIAFNAPDDFTELTEDWDIVSRTDTRIVLIHVSGGNGGTDNLVFEKN